MVHGPVLGPVSLWFYPVVLPVRGSVVLLYCGPACGTLVVL